MSYESVAIQGRKLTRFPDVLNIKCEIKDNLQIWRMGDCGIGLP